MFQHDGIDAFSMGICSGDVDTIVMMLDEAPSGACSVKKLCAYALVTLRYQKGGEKAHRAAASMIEAIMSRVQPRIRSLEELILTCDDIEKAIPYAGRALHMNIKRSISPLHAAVELNNIHAVKILIKMNLGDVKVKLGGYTAEELALKLGFIGIATYLQQIRTDSEMRALLITQEIQRAADALDARRRKSKARCEAAGTTKKEKGATQRCQIFTS